MGGSPGIPLVLWRGTYVSRDMVDPLDDLAASVEPTVVPIKGYGSYRDNTNSGGTDNGSGHLDVWANTAGWTSTDRAAFVANGRERGFMIFERQPRWWSPIRQRWLTEDWGWHFHLILKDSADLSDGARKQLSQWYAGSNGLAGFWWNGVYRYDPDPHPRTHLRQTWSQYQQEEDMSFTQEDRTNLNRVLSAVTGFRGEEAGRYSWLVGKLNDMLAQMAEDDATPVTISPDGVGTVAEELARRISDAADADHAAQMATLTESINGLAATLLQTHPEPLPEPFTPTHGIDVSDYQSDAVVTEWLARSAFAIVKATEGKGYVAPAYAKQMEMVRQAGVGVGAYGLAWPENGWQADFDNFVRTSGLRVGEVGMLDFEPWPKKQPLAKPETFPAYIVGWADAHLAKYGVDPLTYIPDYFIPGIKQHATDAQWERIASLPYVKPGRGGLYVADPTPGPGETFGLRLVMWQWTDKPLDQNILFVDWATLAATKS